MIISLHKRACYRDTACLPLRASFSCRGVGCVHTSLNVARAILWSSSLEVAGFAGLWTPLLARISGHTLYAVDRPGFGLTDTIEHRTETLRETVVGFLEGVLDTLEIDWATLVAHSMGSLWTFWLALDRPERVAHMIHVGCPAHLFDTGLPMPLPLLSVPVIGQLLMALMPPSPRQAQMVYGSMNEREVLKKDPALEAAIVSTDRLPRYRPALRSLMRSIVTPFGTRRGIPLTAEQLRGIRQPVQLIWGKEDPIGPVEAGKRAADLIPDATFAVVPGGHLPWLDAPDQVSEIINELLRIRPTNRDPR